LKAMNKTAINELKAAHKHAIDTPKDKHAEAINGLTDEHEATVGSLKTQHEKQLRSVTATAQTNATKLAQQGNGLLSLERDLSAAKAKLEISDNIDKIRLDQIKQL
jgi:hypothetical protein